MTKPFDPIEWATRPCVYRNNSMFHLHPSFPCARVCFSEVWESLHEEYGTPVHGMVWEERFEAKLGDRATAVANKRAEFDRRVDSILQVLESRNKCGYKSV
jgi:hypothetical protein